VRRVCFPLFFPKLLSSRFSYSPYIPYARRIKWVSSISGLKRSGRFENLTIKRPHRCLPRRRPAVRSSSESQQLVLQRWNSSPLWASGFQVLQGLRIPCGINLN
jgi:hypothetical protein